MVVQPFVSTWIANGTPIFKCLLYFFRFKFSLLYVANMIGTACNSRISQANLHLGLNFVHAKNCSHCWSLTQVKIVYLNINDQILVVACIHKYSSGNIARVKSTSFLYYIILKVSYTDASLVLPFVCGVYCSVPVGIACRLVSQQNI